MALNPKIAEYVAQANAFMDTLDTHATGLEGDIKFLNDKITEMQNSPGVLSPEDQTALDAMQARVEASVGRIAAADALTPPVVPAV